MPVSFSLHRSVPYRARFWWHAHAFDTTRKIPDAFWDELGMQPPTQASDKADKIALKWAAQQASEIEKTLKVRPKGRKTFAQTWEMYKEQNPDGVVPATILRNDICARNVLTFAESIGRPNILPEEIDIAFATKFRNWRMKQDVSPRTVLDEMQFAKQLCTFALAWASETHCTALRLVKLPRVELPDNDGIALTEEEFGNVLEKTRTERDRQILIQGVTTRLRKSNLLGMRAEWFDRERRWMTIGRELLKGGRRKVKRDLSAPVADWTIEQLGDKKAGLLWPNERTGKAMNWFEHVLEQLIADSKVRAFSLHDLRTTGNSWLDAAGVDKMTQTYLLTHAQSGDVTDLYRKKHEPELRAAVDVYDQIRKRNRW